MLRDFEVRKESVSYRGQSVEIRGLSLFDITTLIRTHLGDMNAVFALYKQDATDGSALADSVIFAMKLVQTAPDLVAAIIVQACDEPSTPETVEHVQRLPLGLQVELIRKIMDITFEEAGGAKKLFDSLAMMATQMKPT